nr:hypothetical protein [uncultured Roseovarius sp.]
MQGDDLFVGKNGFRCSFSESPMGGALIQAIAALPGAETFEPSEIERKARFMWELSKSARRNALKRNLPASQSASDKELRKLNDLCGKLADHIEDMHAPAITALANEGILAISMAEDLRKMMEGARYAFGACVGQEARGRKPEIAAAQISEIAGSMYEYITGKRPTITTDPYTGKVSGVWPDFLQAVFEALHVHASVANQSRAISELMHRENLY